MKRLSIIFLAALAAAPITSSAFEFDGAALMEKVPTLKTLSYSICVLSFCYAQYKDSQASRKWSKWYDARYKAQIELKKLIDSGQLEAPEGGIHNHLFVKKTIEDALTSEGNILTEKLDQNTKEILRTGWKAYRDENRLGDLAAGIAFVAGAIGFCSPPNS